MSIKKEKMSEREIKDKGHAEKKVKDRKQKKFT
jgi:hypothetical protein